MGRLPSRMGAETSLVDASSSPVRERYGHHFLTSVHVLCSPHAESVLEFDGFGREKNLLTPDALPFLIANRTVHQLHTNTDPAHPYPLGSLVSLQATTRPAKSSEVLTR